MSTALLPATPSVAISFKEGRTLTLRVKSGEFPSLPEQAVGNIPRFDIAASAAGKEG